MDFNYLVDGQSLTVQVEPSAAGYSVTVNGRAYVVSLATVPGRPGELTLTIDGARCLAWVALDGEQRWVALAGQAHTPLVAAAARPSARRRRGAAGHAGALTAQMPGVVRRVLVQAGDQVERGQVLLLLEAMKMEIRVSAPDAGVVEQVSVAEGQAVERGQSLVTLVSSGSAQ